MAINISFNNLRALVTGAGKGIGRGVALKLAQCGANVVAVSRTSTDLKELKKENSKIETLCLDVGEWQPTKSAIEKVGPVDLLVNNAAIAKGDAFGKITEELINEVYNINAKALINISQIVAEGMKSRGTGGAIVNVSSVLGYRAATHSSLYCTSKGIVDQLTRCLAADYGQHNIRVNAVNPSVIRTKMAKPFYDGSFELGAKLKERTPLKRFGEVDEVVYPILFLLSDKASLITGVTLPVDAGASVQFF